MSNITAGDGGSFSSGTAGEEQEQVNHFNGSNSSNLPSNSNNGSISQQDQQPPPPAATKKKRNLPGTPDPNAEVIALSPKTLLATNRFVCEICNKGFQRDQNLQLHRRGHNLPWKLRQRTSTEIRKRVYVCPEPSCVHHNPARALGDLTGIKKHFCRKHGEKKWKCDKCSKKYAVQSDWKAHSKTCGTKEYKCDCGTIFSRRDSFITHRAFCDALTEENKANQGLVVVANNNMGSSNLQSQVNELIPSIPINNNNPNTCSMNNINVSDPLFSHETKIPLQPLSMAGSMFGGAKTTPSSSSCLQLNANSSTLFEGNGNLFAAAASASMSATALLQKAAQMGATASNGSLNSPLMGKTSFTTSMAPPTFVSMQNQNINNGELTNQLIMQKSQQEIIQTELFNAANNNNNGGMFSGVFDQNAVLLKSIENEHHQLGASSNSNNSTNTPRSNGGNPLSGFNGDMMTVDFLGIGGSRPIARNLLEKQQDLEFGGIGQARLQGLSHFQQHAALEKPMWKV
ncbi:Zinc finger, C2H2-like protein [Corchorus olitorius]|uniref:Zinc finger, C2H2-like protein n=1 Tax=Corchorus olitorius TaxID=93759 RepID=A0A1R3K8C9_9ROSI|nr:Zinc finger, C2H2-like protein [Corchorus olitorius]